jgi:mono/diheme cytochrome c family protein
MKNWQLTAAAILAGTIGGVSLMAQVQTQPYSGHGDYQVYCSSCHGTEAKGDGVIAKSLKQRPSDLTQLAKRSNGVFPEKKVFEAIDGRKSTAHGDPDMPAWAEVFAKAKESAGAENAAARIDVLVQYLQNLQVK